MLFLKITIRHVVCTYNISKIEKFEFPSIKSPTFNSILYHLLLEIKYISENCDLDINLIICILHVYACVQIKCLWNDLRAHRKYHAFISSFVRLNDGIDDRKFKDLSVCVEQSHLKCQYNIDFDFCYSHIYLSTSSNPLFWSTDSPSPISNVRFSHVYPHKKLWRLLFYIHNDNIFYATPAPLI